MPLLLLAAVDSNLHSTLEEGERLREVPDSEMVFDILFRVLHLEVKPLLMTLSICVNLAVQIIPLGSNLLPIVQDLREWVGFNPLKVSAFDHGVESQVVYVRGFILFSALRNVCDELFR